MGWSSCFLSAIQLVAARTKVELPPLVTVDAEVDLGTTDGQYFLQARLNVRNRAELVDGAHCNAHIPKPAHGNINTNEPTEL